MIIISGQLAASFSELGNHLEMRSCSTKKIADTIQTKITSSKISKVNKKEIDEWKRSTFCFVLFIFYTHSLSGALSGHSECDFPAPTNGSP